MDKAEYQREYRERRKRENPEEVRAYNREYRRKQRQNPEFKAKEAAWMRQWRKDNPEAVRAMKRRDYERNKFKYAARRFGITPEEYEALILKPCAICGKDYEANNHHLDHDHQSGAIREALCVKCNTGLGSFGDDSELLQKACAYLNKHAQ